MMALLDRTRKNRFLGLHKTVRTAFKLSLREGEGYRMMRLLFGAFFGLFVLAVSTPLLAQDSAADWASSALAAPAPAAPAPTPPNSAVPEKKEEKKEEVKAAGVPPVATLPASPDTPPIEDPLAAFKQAISKQTPEQNATATPAPTAGGFQQPSDLAVDAGVQDLQPLVEEDQEAKRLELEQQAREQAFDAALNGMMPLTPDQIKTLLDKYKVTREASEQRIGGTPKPEVVVQTISLDPGVKPPVIKLSPGHVTSLTMLDITGEPWPVQDVSWGGNFEIISPESGGHLIRISPMGAAEVGNMSIQMVGLKTPVTFTLETQLEVVQYRVDARIPEYGPNASPPIIEQGLTIKAGEDKTVGQILDGVPPAGTEKLTLLGVDPRTSVYRIGGNNYLRTPLTLLSPGWSASAKSADGMTVYVVNDTPVFLLSDRGRMVRAVVEEQRSEP